jgi:hypothetical protein
MANLWIYRSDSLPVTQWIYRFIDGLPGISNQAWMAAPLKLVLSCIRGTYSGNGCAMPALFD